MRLRRRLYHSPPRVFRRQNRANQEANQPEPDQPSPNQSEQNQPAVNQPNQENHPEPNQPEPNQNATNDVTLQDALDKLYTDINSVPSFSDKINDFLRKNHVHSVHKRIVKKIFPRRKIIARFPMDIWMGDLIEYPQYKFNNRQYVYILILIDCFTKKVYAAPMRDKTMQWSVKAFESIFIHLNEFPTHIVTDGGLGTYIRLNQF